MRWTPDTHPSLTFVCDGCPSEKGSAVSVERLVDGKVELIEDAAECERLRQAVVGENRLKNAAEAVVLAMLPAEMKPGEAAADAAVEAPQWAFGEADGKVSFTLPAAAPEELKASLRKALGAEFGDAVTLD